jgi:tetratricopeptide (TPR) repeat protein
MLQQVFAELDAAEAINPNDPELSLLKGFMDLLLAVNLPFANPDQAIGKLRQGHPDYLSHRGIAIGLRDLQRYDEALTEVNQALAAAPDNPDLMYLKAQILSLLQDYQESLPYYAAALTYADQLPASTVWQIRFEECRAQGTTPETCSARATSAASRPN